MESTEEEITCYLCLNPGTEENPFAEPNPCNCRGTIRMHTSCLRELIPVSNRCGICQTRFIDEGFTGVKYLYYPDGSVMEEINYVHSLREGPRKKYYPTGELWEDGNYVNDVIEGSYKTYYKNGQLCSEVNYVNDHKQGLQKIYHENGQLSSEVNYVDDYKEGLQKVYSESGNLQRVTPYVNDLMHGQGISYWHGQIINESYYIDGSLKYLKRYWPNGQLSDHLYYKNAWITHGPSKKYYESGQLKGECNYVDDERHGTYKKYSETGELLSETEYVNGEIV